MLLGSNRYPCGKFRGSRTAAPLKADDVTKAYATLDIVPRFSNRGPNEGAQKRPMAHGRQKQFRGSRTAAPLKPFPHLNPLPRAMRERRKEQLAILQRCRGMKWRASAVSSALVPDSTCDGQVSSSCDDLPGVMERRCFNARGTSVLLAPFALFENPICHSKGRYR